MPQLLPIQVLILKFQTSHITSPGTLLYTPPKYKWTAVTNIFNKNDVSDNNFIITKKFFCKNKTIQIKYCEKSK